ncbi:MAG TPA: hypothetical protein VM557_01245 [Thermoanaerobaculia bacterium]|nr:hypothetical protein [Thermoanaerobaculia bacterium]
MSRKNATNADIDWYLISIDRLKKAGVVLVVLLLAAIAAWWFFASQNPKERARRAVQNAEVAINELANAPDLSAIRSDLDQGQVKLEEARVAFQGGTYPAAEAAAKEAESIARMAMARVPGDSEFDAQFLAIEGDVQYQKGAQGEWRRATTRDALFNGDWVKTGNNATAQLIFANRSLYTVSSNALLEIYASVNPQTSKPQNYVQMQVGTVEINTLDDESTVRTPGSQVVVSSESTAHVGVGRNRQTEILSLKGSSAVTPASGGQALTLAAGQQVDASGEGTFSPVRPILDPPQLLTPVENQVFQSGGDPVVALQWEPNSEAGAYVLQVSRSRLFSSLEIDSRRSTTRASAKVTDQGSFYWRVASIGSDGRRGPFSPFRRFRVVGGSRAPGAVVDKTPPSLELKKPFRFGGQYYLFEGKVEPGASLFVDDEEIPVETDGTFKKLISFSKLGWNTVVVRAVDPSGNQTVLRENVNVVE